MGIANPMRISYKTSLLTELQASLKSIIVDALLHCIPIFSQVFDDCKIYDQQFTCCVEIHTDNPKLSLHMELTLKAGC
jgi:hypothetical protein